MNKEIWKDIPGYENKYQASNLGRIKSLDREIKYITRHKTEALRFFKGTILKIDKKICNAGYYNVVFGDRKSEMVHRIICKTFHGIPKNKKMTVNHINGNKLDNRSENLEWCTQYKNHHHARSLGNFDKWYKKLSLNMAGQGNFNSKLTEKQVIEIRKQKDKTTYYLSKKYNIPYSTIYNIVKYKTWKTIKV